MAKSFPNTGATVIDSVTDLPVASAALEGVMMFQKDTNELKICDGSSWISVIDTDTPSGLSFIKTITYSGANSASFNNIFSSAFDRYRVLIDPIVLSTNNTSNYMYMRLRSNGVDATTLYTYNNYGWATSGTTAPPALGYGEYQAAAFVVGYNYYGGLFMSLDFYNPFLAAITNITGTGLTNSAAIPYNSTFTGRHENAASYDGFTLWAANAASNISGSIRVYGYRNS